MRYYISDLHFYHESLLTKMDCRGFENCDKMHEYMIERWNKKVRENDEVVILGDVSMERGKKTNDIIIILKYSDSVGMCIIICWLCYAVICKHILYHYF